VPVAIDSPPRKKKRRYFKALVAVRVRPEFTLM